MFGFASWRAPRGSQRRARQACSGRPTLCLETLERRDLPAVAVAPVFDADFYLAANPDVAAVVRAGRMTAAQHFERFGQFEGRDPGRLFDTAFYLSQNQDVAAEVKAGRTTAIGHFLSSGEHEGRAPFAMFNTAAYLAANPDVNQAANQGLMTAVEHFMTSGFREGRGRAPAVSGRDLFDPRYYLSHNPDVAAAVAAGLMTAEGHFRAFGITEGRAGNAVFDTAYYLSTNPDVAAAGRTGGLTAFEHFERFGQFEGRNPGPQFCTSFYVANTPGIQFGTQNATLTPVSQFLNVGQPAGLPGAPVVSTPVALSGPTDQPTSGSTGSASDVQPPVAPPVVPPATPPAPPVVPPPPPVVPPPPPPAGTTTTVVLQQDHNGYTGTRAEAISTYGGLGPVGSYNENGMTFGDGFNDWCLGTNIPDAPPYDEVLLMRFDNLPIPANATVTSASLTLTATVYTASSVVLSGGYLARPWDASNTVGGTSSSPLGWRYNNGPSAPWGQPGAAGVGTDLIAGTTFQTTALQSGVTTSVTASLDPAVVQHWVNGQNYGVRVVPGLVGYHVDFVQPQRNGLSDLKPVLTVTYVT